MIGGDSTIPAIKPKVDLPSSTEREREHLKLRTKHTHLPTHREGPSKGAPWLRELSPWQVVERRPAMMAAVFCFILIDAERQQPLATKEWRSE